MKEIVAFSLGEEVFGISVEEIKEISEMMPITLLPKAPSYVLGISNLRGNVVPMVDLKKRLGMHGRHRDDGVVLLTEIKGVVAGLVVDGILDIVKLPEEEIQELPQISESPVDAQFIQGVFHYQGKRCILLNLEKMLT